MSFHGPLVCDELHFPGEIVQRGTKAIPRMQQQALINKT
jgi:hypothetical protein